MWRDSVGSAFFQHLRKEVGFLDELPARAGTALHKYGHFKWVSAAQLRGIHL